MVEIYGKEASGKTTLALHVVKEAQKNGGLHFVYEGLFFFLHPSFILGYISVILLTTKKKILFLWFVAPLKYFISILPFFGILDFDCNISIFGDLSSLPLVHYIQLPDFIILLYKH